MVRKLARRPLSVERLENRTVPTVELTATLPPVDPSPLHPLDDSALTRLDSQDLVHPQLPVEPSIAVSPKDPGNLAIVSELVPTSGITAGIPVPIRRSSLTRATNSGTANNIGLGFYEIQQVIYPGGAGPQIVGCGGPTAQPSAKATDSVSAISLALTDPTAVGQDSNPDKALSGLES